MRDKPHQPAQAGAKEVRQTAKNSGFRTLLGYETAVWRQGYAEIRLLIGPQHLNGLGILHGGVYLTLLDASMGHAVTWCAVEGNSRHAVTVSLTTSFLVPARAGLVVSRGRIVADDGEIVTCQGDVVDAQGELLAAGQGSFRYLAGSETAAGVPNRA